MTVTVEKVWDDADDQDGIRPDNVEVTLMIGEEAVTQEGITAAQTLSEENDWTYTWEGLEKYADGEEIEYTVVETETAVITGTDGPGTYEYEVTGSIEDGFTVTNTHTPEEVTVTVEKVWDDADNQDGIRPTSVEVTLMAGDAAVSQEGIAAVQTLDESNRWTYTWEGLNKYADGEEIGYTVEETETDVITGTDGAGTYAYEVTGNMEDGYTVTNTHTPEKVTVVLTKTWTDSIDDSMRPKPDGFAELVTLTATNDSTFEAPAPNAAVSENDKNVYIVTWSDLPKYKPNAVGELMTYKVVESDINLYEGQVEQKTGSTYEYVAENTRKTAEVWLGKQVTGNQGDRNKEFRFVVTVVGADGKTSITIADVTGEDIVRTHGNASKLGTFPVGAKVTIEEAKTDYDPAEYGVKTQAGETNADKQEKNYSVTFTVAENGNTVTFYNNKEAEIDTGIPTESKPYLLLLGLIPLAGIAMFLGIRRRRRFEV